MEEYVAKVELFWEQKGVTEEDFPRLHQWVQKLNDGNYKNYYSLYIDKTQVDSKLGNVFRDFLRELNPLDVQFRMSYDEWQIKREEHDKKKEEEKRNKIQNGLTVFGCACFAAIIIILLMMVF